MTALYMDITGGPRPPFSPSWWDQRKFSLPQGRSPSRPQLETPGETQTPPSQEKACQHTPEKQELERAILKHCGLTYPDWHPSAVEGKREETSLAFETLVPHCKLCGESNNVLKDRELVYVYWRAYLNLGIIIVCEEEKKKYFVT